MLQQTSVMAKKATADVSSLDGAGAKKIRKVDRMLRRLREIDDNMPLSMANALIIVSLNEGKSLQDLAELADISISNFSRYILALSDRQRTGGPGSGHGLVIREQDLRNLRKNRYYLSPKGRMLVNELLEIV
jgi:DNA-binding MarR family transcriptional regulator